MFPFNNFLSEIPNMHMLPVDAIAQVPGAVFNISFLFLPMLTCLQVSVFLMVMFSLLLRQYSKILFYLLYSLVSFLFHFKGSRM